MKKLGVLFIIVTFLLLAFVSGLPSQARFFLGAFGFGVGLVLILISGIEMFGDE